jgi:hypothetical protein
MKIPQIEKQIKKRGHLIVACTSFLGLGMTAISAVTATPLVTTMLINIVSPLILDFIAIETMLNKGKLPMNTNLLTDHFKTNIKKLINDYIENSENITEKKYKVACLALWTKYKEIDFNKIASQHMFLELSGEINKENMTNSIFPLYGLFEKDINDIKSMFGVEPSVKTFLKDDADDSWKINIAKKVYEEYSELGMAAKAFLNRNDFMGLLMIQDYKFSSKDYSLIEKYLENAQKGIEQHDKSFRTVELYSDTTKEALTKIIEAEDNIKHLEIIKRYCSEILCKSSLEIFASLADKKINYIEMNKDLDTKDSPIKPKKVKL